MRLKNIYIRKQQRCNMFAYRQLWPKKEPKMERQKAGSYHQTVTQAKRLKLAKACGLRNDG
jgi:hypothetical protein